MPAGARRAPWDDGDVARRIRFRSPGVKPGQKIGPLGPFRGRLGLSWVIAPLVLGAILVVAGWLFLRGDGPEAPWRPVGEVSSLPLGEGREVLPGIHLARLPDGRVFAVAREPGCELRPEDDGYLDCEGALFGLDGLPEAEGEALDLVPVRIHEGTLYVQPEDRIER